MALRVVALLLLLVLSWSGLGMLEPPRLVAPSSAPQEHAVVQAAAQATGQGHPMEQHDVEVVPSTTHGESSSETPGLLPESLTPADQSPRSVRPVPAATAEAASPFLAGPLRPPCPAALAA